MKRLLVSNLMAFLACSFLILGTMAWAKDLGGKATFESLKCHICHKPDRKSAGPSLEEIAKAYSGQEQRLTQYLTGESEPLVDPGKGRVMVGQLKKTKKISDTERQDLAAYILSFGGK